MQRTGTSSHVLSRLFRRLMLERLLAAHEAGKLVFFGAYAHLSDTAAFEAFLAPLRKTKWFVYSKRPFAGPAAVLAYLSRYTHRVAISNRRLISADENGVTFKVKHYRIEGPDRYKTLTLSPAEFIRRFLMHVLPKGLHRIRHYGLFASNAKSENLARMRALLDVATSAADSPAADIPIDEPQVRHCPCCGARITIIETFERGSQPRYRSSAAPDIIRIDTS